MDVEQKGCLDSVSIYLPQGGCDGLSFRGLGQKTERANPSSTLTADLMRFSDFGKQMR